MSHSFFRAYLIAAHICGVLLTAEASKRVGSDKLMYPHSGMTPVAVAALANLRSAVPRSATRLTRSQTK